MKHGIGKPPKDIQMTRLATKKHEDAGERDQNIKESSMNKMS